MSLDFKRLAEKHIENLRASPITPTTEVFLEFHSTDLQGNVIPPFRRSVCTDVSVSIPGNRPAAEKVAHALLVDTIAKNINAAIGHTNEAYYREKHRVIVTKVSLVIEDFIGTPA